MKLLTNLNFFSSAFLPLLKLLLLLACRIFSFYAILYVPTLLLTDLGVFFDALLFMMFIMAALVDFAVAAVAGAICSLYVLKLPLSIFIATSYSLRYVTGSGSPLLVFRVVDAVLVGPRECGRCEGFDFEDWGIWWAAYPVTGIAGGEVRLFNIWYWVCLDEWSPEWYIVFKAFEEVVAWRELYPD